MSGRQKVLITGANGYIGSHLTECLHAAGHKVFALCFEENDAMQKWGAMGIPILRGDITSPSCFELFENDCFDSIIHLVSLNHFDSEKDPMRSLRVNVQPTWDLLHFFSKRGLKKFIYFSTQQVYGRLSADRVDEDYPVKPVNAYGLTHLQSEQIVRLYKDTTDVDAISIRLSNSYGAPVFAQNSCWWLVVNDFCVSAYQKQSIKILSDGSPLRDFIHVKDVAAAVKTLLEGEALSQSCYHVSSGLSYSIWELAQWVQSIYQQRYGVSCAILDKEELGFPHPKNSRTLPKYCISNEALKEAGAVLSMDLSQGIHGLFDYLEQSSIS